MIVVTTMNVLGSTHTVCKNNAETQLSASHRTSINSLLILTSNINLPDLGTVLSAGWSGQDGKKSERRILYMNRSCLQLF